MSTPPAAPSRRARLWAGVAVAIFALALNWLIEWRGQPPEPTGNPPLPYPASAPSL